MCFFGAWRGFCVVCCESDVAKELTQRFLGMASASPDEVANIIGGNVKNLLPRGVDHSMPVFGVSIPPTGEAVVTTAFHCTAGPLWISLIREAC